ncbi:MAG: hypothetical protein ACR2RF_12075 [Geminicoccaceae bacterium]
MITTYLKKGNPMSRAAKPFINFHRVAPFSASNPPTPVLRRFCQALAHGWRTAARYRRLELMNDKELARLGIDRASIGRYAFFSEQPIGRR